MTNKKLVSTEICRNMTSAVWAHDRYSTATAPSAECTGNSARRSAGLKLSHRSLELMILSWKEGAPEDDSSTSFGCQCVVFRVKCFLLCFQTDFCQRVQDIRRLSISVQYRTICSAFAGYLVVRPNLNGELAGGNAHSVTSFPC